MPAAKPHLPDGARKQGPFRPYTSDPGWNEAWWWLAVPLMVAVLLIAINTVAPGFYERHILPEGYGVLELSHFFVPLAGLVLAVRLLFRDSVRQRKLVFLLCAFAAFACFYIAGEEHSWGQHFFHWQTPEYWSEINRQQETNLHNTLHLFDKKPRAILELGVLIGGLIIPVAAWFWPTVRANRWSLFLPAAAMVPTALGAILFKLTDTLWDNFSIKPLVARPSEAIEFYLYLFILFYLVILTRRIREIEAEN